MRGARAARRSSRAPIEYDPRLIEESVRSALVCGVGTVAAARLIRLRHRHRQRLDELYSIHDLERREAAFRDHFMELFRGLGLDRLLPTWLVRFPRLRTDLERILVRSSPRGAQGAELWESREQRGCGIPRYLLVAVSPPDFHRPDEMSRLLLPKLLMAADVLDPEFGFRPDQLRSGRGGARDAVRTVYEGLWELSARARLEATGARPDPGLRADAEARLPARAEGGVPWTAGTLLDALVAEPLHTRLLLLAEELAAIDDRRLPRASGPCPLCRFPTTRWADAEALALAEPGIAADFPTWSVEVGCCEHCAERYGVLDSSMAAP